MFNVEINRSHLTSVQLTRDTARATPACPIYILHYVEQSNTLTRSSSPLNIPSNIPGESKQVNVRVK